MLSEKIDGMGLLCPSLPADIDIHDCGREDETKLDTGASACGNELVKRDQVAHMFPQQILGAADQVVGGHDVDLSGIFAEPVRHDARFLSLFITVVALVAQGITDSSLKFHIANAKSHGVTQKEMAAAITHVAFYAGWPKAWAAFNLAKSVYGEEE